MHVAVHSIDKQVDEVSKKKDKQVDDDIYSSSEKEKDARGKILLISVC